MIAAIYARKSTEQNGVADEAKSVTRQIDHAKVYAARKGWTVPDNCIFVDDGISGAEFANRPGFVRLMATLKPRPPFQMLVMSEESRLGREAIETAYALKQLISAGVRVFFYLEDRERTFDSPTDKLLMSVTAFADELEREKARQRTYDAMQRKAKAGHVTGGKTFGYDNIEVLATDGKRSHVERRINADEAAVVRRIFEMCADGSGLTRITKALNADGCPAPRPQRGRPVGWAHTTVREVLLRELYRGVIVWNRSRKRDRWGQHRQQPRPEAEWMRVPLPDVRIVSDALWAAAHRQLNARRAEHAQTKQRPTDPIAGTRTLDVSPRYLLTGVGRCAVCGGGWLGHTRDHGTKRAKFYGCATHWKRGTRVCGNDMVARVEAVNAEVIATLTDDVFRPAVFEQAVAFALDDMAPAGADRARRHLEGELRAVTDECGRLAEAIGRGGRLTSLLDRLARLERRAEAIRVELAAYPAALPTFNRAALERRLRGKLADWRGLLTRDVVAGNATLRTILAEPIRFTPVREERRVGYRFEGRIAIDRMIAGLVEVPELTAKLHQLGTSPAGFVASWMSMEGVTEYLRAA
jgi:DNA invertase Pin-like site-specific DNA recombinase